MWLHLSTLSFNKVLFMLFLVDLLSTDSNRIVELKLSTHKVSILEYISATCHLSCRMFEYVQTQVQQILSDICHATWYLN